MSDDKLVARAAARFLLNETTLRREAIAKLLNPGKDINYECGYPDSIATTDYRQMYDRESVAWRVVRVLPEECWKSPPSIYETEKAEKTQWDKAWSDLQTHRSIIQYMQRIDILSGIGRFGVLLLGISDGKNLNEPVEGIDEMTGEKTGNAKYELMYLKALDENAVEIDKKEGDKTSPRYGMPKLYSIDFDKGTGEVRQVNTKVHWTRVVHIADNRDTSDVYGTPRMQPVYNRLLDIRKVLSGSGEMFWKGGFPGYNAVFDPKVVTPDMIQDETFVAAIKENLKTEIQKLFAGMQRVTGLVGMELKSLQPQVADPKGHFDTHLRGVALALGVPYRIFIGTEEAKLASSQDVRNWNSRVANRQTNYLDPMLIRPVVDRLMAFGVLPEAKQYTIEWPDLNIVTEKDAAEVARIVTEALARYVTGDVAPIFPPLEYFTKILGMEQDEAEEVIRASQMFEPPIDEQEQDGQVPVPDDEDADAA
jgi:hypothetical protein